MGRHSASEEEEPVAPTSQRRLVRVWVDYCQPFYKRYRKGIIAVASAVLVTLQAVITNGITATEWGLIVTAALGAAGVIKVPNATNKKVVKNDKVQ